MMRRRDRIQLEFGTLRGHRDVRALSHDSSLRRSLRRPIPFRVVSTLGVIALFWSMGCTGEMNNQVNKAGPQIGQEPGEGSDPGTPGNRVPNAGSETPGEEPPKFIPTETNRCATPEQTFVWDMYAPVFSKCIGCHNSFGLAGTHDLRYQMKFPGSPGFAEYNVDILRTLASEEVTTASGESMPLLLAKATNRAPSGHVGGEMLKPDSAEAQLLTSYIDNLLEPQDCDESPRDVARDLIDAVELMSYRETYARAHFALLSEPATPEQLDAMEDTPEALNAKLEEIFADERFYDRLGEYYEDALKTSANSGKVSYSTGPFIYGTGWKQLRFFNSVCSGEPRNPCCHLGTQECCSEYHSEDYCDVRNLGANDLAFEPLELIQYVAREDLPITEVMLADYGMINPPVASIVGFTPEQRDQAFDNDPSNDRTEFKPLRIPTTELNNLEPGPDGESNFPHVGILSMSSTLKRFNSTRSNVHRTRAARLVLDTFLSVPVLHFGDFNTNILPPEADLELATQQYPVCTSCHAAIDPIAAHFRLHPGGGRYNPSSRRAKLPEHLPSASFLGEPAPEQGNPLRFLAEKIAAHERYPLAMLEPLLAGLMGTELIYVPSNTSDPAFQSKVLAFRIQQLLLEDAFNQLPGAQDLTFKQMVKTVVFSPAFRAKGVQRDLDALEEEALRRAGVGGRRLMTPEQLERKWMALTGIDSVSRHDYIARFSGYRYLMGSTDWFSIPERDREPNPIAVRIVERLANRFACQGTVRDFSFTDPNQRRLFKNVEIDTLPDEEGSAKIKTEIRRLHRLVLGEDLPEDHPELQASWELWKAAYDLGQTIIAEGGRQATRTNCSVSSRAIEDETGRVEVSDDPHFTIRAWTALMAYMFADSRFMLE